MSNSAKSEQEKFKELLKYVKCMLNALDGDLISLGKIEDEILNYSPLSQVQGDKSRLVG